MSPMDHAWACREVGTQTEKKSHILSLEEDYNQVQLRWKNSRNAWKNGRDAAQSLQQIAEKGPHQRWEHSEPQTVPSSWLLNSSEVMGTVKCSGSHSVNEWNYSRGRAIKFLVGFPSHLCLHHFSQFGRKPWFEVFSAHASPSPRRKASSCYLCTFLISPSVAFSSALNYRASMPCTESLQPISCVSFITGLIPERIWGGFQIHNKYKTMSFRKNLRGKLEIIWEEKDHCTKKLGWSSLPWITGGQGKKMNILDI